jgi:hypothetical protein
MLVGFAQKGGGRDMPPKPRPAEIWCDDWRRKHVDLIRARGAASVRDFLAAHPGETYARLSDHLGGRVAPVQLIELQMAEATDAGAFREAALDCLVRVIAEGLKRGWNRGGHRDLNRAQVQVRFLSSVSGFAAAAGIEEHGAGVWRELAALTIPDAWVPRDNGDAYVLEAFRRGWPASPNTV